ncbi:putative AAA+ superfamily ATPase [Dyadobacter sp. BE34]|uniref:AAA+ superfamily ATPase n=1 Tax=Dyadobacter fermentans TaxID=94254 RepID=A0ABU1R373_9BACT|nr:MULTISPECIES: ATP-binding protein [Dyadobacter]MDR6807825.1 putative AAA+ superfamily ATPase [Dyadobacter fermentans]MDR7045566.1 putative AAA+ superfamily ATPase [Dyadobacter sp. BE242]MDR7199879.1 putative AAA+ superfamily ATPase [Dyadobacter sp. BE34]MDR7217662.1 putative AAA+ superfamily ATPase [Dyadobacter sp. BE31]MDR7265770.1 putative AAA+ superfamily ATPase [Dyadobacter sp. BE32]
MINRAIEATVLRSLNFFPVVGILGPRQVGKTTLARKLIGELNKPVVYYDLELVEDFETLSQNTTWVLENNINKTIVIDEVQRLLPLFPQLRALVDRKREAGRFILLGSASPDFLQKSSESLAGRIAYHELMPILKSEAESSFIPQPTHWHRGGFPDALLAPDNGYWYQWQQNFIKTYVEQDLSAMGISTTIPLLNNFLRMISHVHGSLLNYSTLSNSLGMANNTVRRYVEILEQAYLIRRLEPWFVNVSKRIVKSPKIYIRGSGNLHFLSNIRHYEDLITHPIAGASWEGYVIEQIIPLLDPGIRPYFYRTSNGAEMDLILVDGITPVVSIEIKLSLAPALKRGSTESANDLQTEHNFVVTPNGGNIAVRPKWLHCNISELIEHLKTLNMVAQY